MDDVNRDRINPDHDLADMVRAFGRTSENLLRHHIRHGGDVTASRRPYLRNYQVLADIETELRERGHSVLAVSLRVQHDLNVAYVLGYRHTEEERSRNLAKALWVTHECVRKAVKGS